MTDQLEIRDLVIRFGGHTAVDHFSLTAPVGRITGLIGPNGAGKSTTFNAVSGLLKPADGSVRFGEHDLLQMTPVRRAHVGIGRTFQRMELCEGLTVAENVALGLEARYAGANPLTLVMARRDERSAVDDAVAHALDSCRLGDIARSRAGALSTGQRRLVELARCIAGGFRLLLLDEPSSGLDYKESEFFAELLRQIVADGTTGILLVEHDMTLISDVCDYVYVLDFGKPIYDGTASEVLSSEIVRAAYLGTQSDLIEEAV